MYTREYRCRNCDSEWSGISDYPDLECPECRGDDIAVIWQARAYD